MKEKFQKFKSLVKYNWVTFCSTIMMARVGIIPSFAGNVSAKAMVGNMIGIVCSIFSYIGMLLLVWGIGQLVLAFKNEDADSKSRAMMLIVASIVLMSVRAIVGTLGLDITIGEGLTT